MSNAHNCPGKDLWTVLSDSATERLAVERSNIALSPTTSAADIALATASVNSRRHPQRLGNATPGHRCVLAHKVLSRRDEDEAHGYVRHPTDPATPEH